MQLRKVCSLDRFNRIIFNFNSRVVATFNMLFALGRSSICMLQVIVAAPLFFEVNVSGISVNDVIVMSRAHQSRLLRPH